MTTTDDTRLPLTSTDVAAERLDALREIFPEAFTEGRVDLHRLRVLLGEDEATGPERYGLSWAGKAEAIRAAQSLSSGTLLPAPDESVNWDTTENLIIEGDNLEVLKLLQKAYHGRVKMIYIDPPYNTGGEFIYPDNFREGLQDYLRYSGQVDGDGLKLTTNTETDGRFHSNWLSMMLPRLMLARNLLAEDGIIFVSIDDHEAHDLRALLDEIFGEENFLANIAWEKRYTRSNNARMFYSLKDSIIAFRRSPVLPYLRENRTDKSDSIYGNPDNDPRGAWTSSSVERVPLPGGQAYAVAGGLLLVCLEDPITPEQIAAMIAHRPRQVICLDHAFRGVDQLKANTKLQMKAADDIAFHTV